LLKHLFNLKLGIRFYKPISIGNKGVSGVRGFILMWNFTIPLWSNSCCNS